MAIDIQIPSEKTGFQPQECLEDHQTHRRLSLAEIAV